MLPELIGRKPEQAIMRVALETEEAEMISVIGGRRIGKTKMTYLKKRLKLKSICS